MDHAIPPRTIQVDLRFGPEAPLLGDLLNLCGIDAPDSPTTPGQPWAALDDLGVCQIDDYYGIPAEDDAGDVRLWLFPGIGPVAEVYHHPGPFDWLRLDYPLLRTPPQTARLLIAVLGRMAATFAVAVAIPLLGGAVAWPAARHSLVALIDATIAAWQEQGIEPGSPGAFRIVR
ncbi:MAG TPA: hypothetical protein VGE07_09115 [Herpetosiphonaceae bacterium]